VFHIFREPSDQPLPVSLVNIKVERGDINKEENYPENKVEKC
jgi:hypothetical protein